MQTTEFDFQIDIAKASTVDGKDYVIRGIASSPSVDRDDEQMSPDAIKAMLQQIKSSKIPLVNEHGRSWHDRIGEITDGEIMSDGKLVIEAKLNKKHPIAQYLYDAIKSGEQFGLSVAGKVKGFTQHMRTDLGKFIRVFHDIALKEISVTGRPANWDAMGLTAKTLAFEIAKSVPEEVWLETEKGNTMDEETKVDATEEEAATEDAAPSSNAEETEASAEDTEDVAKSKPVKKLPRKKREDMMKAFDAKFAALRQEFADQLGLETQKSEDEVAEDSDEADEATEESEDEVVKAIKESKVTELLTEIVKSATGNYDEKFKVVAEELKKSNDRIEKLMSLPLRRKGIAAGSDAGQEAIIALKSDTQTETKEPEDFKSAYINLQQ